MLYLILVIAIGTPAAGQDKRSRGG